MAHVGVLAAGECLVEGDSSIDGLGLAAANEGVGGLEEGFPTNEGAPPSDDQLLGMLVDAAS